MQGSRNLVKFAAKKQPTKRKDKQWKMARKAMRRHKQYHQNVSIAFGR